MQPLSGADVPTRVRYTMGTWQAARTRAVAALTIMCGLVVLNLAFRAGLKVGEEKAAAMGVVSGPTRHLSAISVDPVVLQPVQQDLKPTSEHAAALTSTSTESTQASTTKSEASASAAAAVDPSKLVHHYMIGYGSLINDKSRTATSKTGIAHPVLVKGLRREWDYHQEKRGMTALGVVYDETSSVNGVLVAVHEDDLPAFDKREGDYTRTEVAHHLVEFLQVQNAPEDRPVLLPQDHVWVYVTNHISEPTKKLPIAQSYVDVVLDGCLKYGRAFAEDCIRNTGKWAMDTPPVPDEWVDDRKDPLIYTTDFVSPYSKQVIDDMLKKLVPSAFALRKPFVRPEGVKIVIPQLPDQAKKANFTDAQRLLWQQKQQQLAQQGQQAKTETVVRQDIVQNTPKQQNATQTR